MNVAEQSQTITFGRFAQGGMKLASGVFQGISNSVNAIGAAQQARAEARAELSNPASELADYMADGQVPKNGFPKVVEQMAKLPRILFVGLNDDEIAHVEDSLGDIDCQIETVAAGSAVFDRLQRFQPHLVVLDTAIANPDAFDLCARIKNDHTAIVIIATAFSDLDDINRAVDAGTDDFLSKPINKHELRKRVENLLKLRDTLD